jgi:hypothetical protein
MNRGRLKEHLHHLINGFNVIPFKEPTVGSEINSDCRAIRCDFLQDGFISRGFGAGEIPGYALLGSGGIVYEMPWPKFALVKALVDVHQGVSPRGDGPGSAFLNIRRWMVFQFVEGVLLYKNLPDALFIHGGL